MSTKALGKFFLFNIALLCMVIGFSMGVFTSSCSTRLPAGEAAYAQDTTIRDADVATLESMQYSFRKVAAKVLPVTVAIDVVDIVDGGDSPLGEFFSPFRREDDSSPQLRRPSAGSGVIVRRSGKRVYILTNNHVVGDMEEIRVRLNDGREYDAVFVGGDVRKDLALVAIETDEQDITVAELGDSSGVHVGDWALAVGNPFFLENTITAGIVSAIGRRGRGPAENISDFIQTDAAINPGNSGGALVDIRGRVIGINTWIATETGVDMGYGFAIPINNAKKAIDDFIDLGKVQYAWLGVQITEPPQEVAEGLGIEEKRGAFVTYVFRNSPAGKGGIHPGDFIVALNGAEINDFRELTYRLGDLVPGRKADFELIRLGEKIQLSIELSVRQDEDAINTLNSELWPGMFVLSLTEERRNSFDIKAKVGVIVTEVTRDTPAASAGFQAEDVITEIDGEAIGNLKDYYRAIGTVGRAGLSFRIERNGTQIDLKIK